MAAFTVRKEVDFIALAPVVLGFYPHHSLVMMTLSGFHARVDLPAQDGIQECINALLEPARKHSVKQVVVVTYDADDVDVLSQFIDNFSDAGIDVVAALEVRDGQYRRVNDVAWTPFDLASHPITLEAQYIDRAPRHASREALVESIQPQGAGWSGEVAEAVEQLQEYGRDELVESASREVAGESVKLWSAALRGCEPDSELVSDIALLVALNAWLSGDGALAWVALDLADPDSTLHELMTRTLNQAVPPSAWPVP